jgi:hypothetical protein
MLTAGQAVQQGDWQRRWQQTLVSDRIWSAQQLAQLRQAPWSLQLAFGRDDSRQPTETPDTACRFQCSPGLRPLQHLTKPFGPPAEQQLFLSVPLQLGLHVSLGHPQGLCWRSCRQRSLQTPATVRMLAS